MNWKTKEILDDLDEVLRVDGHVFTNEQLVILECMAKTFRDALNREGRCIGLGINHIR